MTHYIVKLPVVQRIAIDGADYALVPGEKISLPDAPYVQELAAQGLLLLAETEAKTQPKPKN